MKSEENKCFEEQKYSWKIESWDHLSSFQQKATLKVFSLKELKDYREQTQQNLLF